MLKLKFQYFGYLMWRADTSGKDPDVSEDWGQEEMGATEDKMVGWHHWLNGLEFEQTLGDSEAIMLVVLQFMGSQRVRHNLSTTQQQQRSPRAHMASLCKSESSCLIPADAPCDRHTMSDGQSRAVPSSRWTYLTLVLKEITGWTLMLPLYSKQLVQPSMTLLGLSWRILGHFPLYLFHCWAHFNDFYFS